MMRKICVALCLFCSISAVNAAYITDKLVAGLYEEPKTDTEPLKALSTGTPLEVIERKDDFIKVRTPDGTVGWVESAYLTDEKPARSMLLEVQASNSTLKKQLDRLLDGKPVECQSVDQPIADNKQECAADQLQQQLEQLQLQLQQEKSAVELMQQQLQSTKADNKTLLQKQNQIAKILQVEVKNPETSNQPATVNQTLLAQFSNKLIWLAGALVLLAGFISGYFFMRQRVTRRFGKAMRF